MNEHRAGRGTLTRVSLLAAALAVGLAAAPERGELHAQQPAPPAVTTVDVVAVDGQGRPVEGLVPADFVLTVDGRARPVLSVRHVSRGPGAVADATGLATRSDGKAQFAAEPSRTILILVDQETLERGEETWAVRASTALLDRLGLGDRVAVVALPLLSQTSVNLTTDRPEMRAALALVKGQRTRRALAVPAMPSQDSASVAGASSDQTGDPDRKATVEQVEVPAAAELSDAGTPEARGCLASLRQVLLPLQSVPGRKTVVLLSAGLPRGTWRRNQLEAVAREAIASHSVLYALGTGTERYDDRSAPDFTPLQSLATMTGGSSAMVEKNAERTVERLVAEISSCYVLGVETQASDGDAKTHPLKVTSRRAAALRSASMLLAHPDSADVPVTAAAAPAPAAPGGRESATGSSAARDSEARELTDGVLSRAGDYLEAYQQAFSAVVAEELYEQNTGSALVRLRSDLLLIRSGEDQRWVSFRDVFEVDGNPVRERNERLKRLFLEPHADATEQLEAIKTESARYNIGPVLRNINVPLYALAILQPENRARFRFKAKRNGQADGIEIWRLDFQEEAHPTLVVNRDTNQDLPLSGYFLIAADTGAIVETSMTLRDGQTTSDYLVRYGRDDKLGLWVPVQMSELYTDTVRGTRRMAATARYSDFRRFQVKTDITIQK